MSPNLANKQVFESLFRAHYPPLVWYATKMLSDEDAAADIVQQMFVNLWEKRGQLIIEGKVSSYLLRSVHNACLNAIKHNKIKANHQVHIQHDGDDAVFHDALEEVEFRLQVRHAVQSLPTQCRKVFLMSRINGMKYQQIADELAISVKTVENQMD